ncbi:MAG: epimerase [Cyclobacteriaceae bacterium]|nr:MAG: epimerase [Cyclobacteriaceae bacterium]
MKILLTGATGYIGKRLIPGLIKKGYQVICCVRDANRFETNESYKEHITVLEIDLLDRTSLKRIPDDIDGAYYLVHSMSDAEDYQDLESRSAINFREAMNRTSVRHVIYLGGILNDESLSEHLNSRKKVEQELSKGSYHFTALRASIIIGSGSASFEIIRDLVEKLPVMVAPRWLRTRSQPIAISDVIRMLEQTMFNEHTFDDNFDIGGPEILSYKNMLLGFARIRGLTRYIYIVPVMTPKLSSYWLYFITATSYKLAVALVESMKVEVVCRDDRINEILNIQPVGYEQALRKTQAAIEENRIISSWKDAFVSGDLDFQLSEFINVPIHGCFRDKRIKPVSSKEKTLERIWRIGGKSGWYYANWLWKIRGFIDKLVGGVGLRRGRTHDSNITAGNAIDFWRVLYANKQEGRLLLFAEMRLPGEAWLEFRLTDGYLEQTATFRPKGVLGRLYWYMVFPLHGFIFEGLISSLVNDNGYLSGNAGKQ